MPRLALLQSGTFASKAESFDHHEKLILAKRLDPCLGGFDRANGISLVFQQGAERDPHVFFVIHDEQWRQWQAHLAVAFNGGCLFSTWFWPEIVR